MRRIGFSLGLLICAASASAQLQVLNGGTGTAAAPTLGQILIAQSGTLYLAKTISGDTTITSAGVVTVDGIEGVPFCSGFTPTNGQFIQYTTGGTPNPCFSAAAPSGGVSTFSAGTTGFTPNSATAGAVTLAGILSAANGGLGISTSASTGCPSVASGTWSIAACPTGTVTTVSVVTANGVSGSVATATTTPAITLTLGAITPTSTNGVLAATMAFMDATSSVQTQLNGKQASLGYTPAHSGANSDITSLTGLSTPLSAAQGGTGEAGTITGLLYGNATSAVTQATSAQVLSALPASAQWSSPGLNNGTSTPTSNVTKMFDFVLPYNVTATNISYSISTADNTAHLYDIGIYSATGSLLCHIGATAGTSFAPGTGVQTRPFLAGCSLSGSTRYLLAYTVNTQAAILNGSGNVLMAIGGTQPSSGNTTTGGVLNNSVTPPTDVWTAGVVFPLISLHN